MASDSKFTTWLKSKWDILNNDNIPQKRKNRQFLTLALEWQTFVLTAVLAVLNMKRNQQLLSLLLVSSWPFLIFATIWTIVKKDRKPAIILYEAFFILIFTYAVYAGPNDGAGMLWVYLMPILIISIFGVKPALVIDIWFSLLFLILAVSPKLRSLLQYTYPEGRFLNCLFMFLSDIIISFIIMTGNMESLAYQNDYANRLKDALDEEREKVNGISKQTILAINRAVEAKDKYTGNHSKRVAEISRKIAEKLDWSESELKRIYDIALLHDIGKIGINCDILTKKGNLTEEEHTSIKKHTVIGDEILQEVDFIPGISDIVRHHHEFWDGSGYPDGISGKDIPIEARIIAVADSFDSMLHGRSYRKKMPVSQIKEDLLAKSGTRYDPDIIPIVIELCDSGEITNETEEASDE